MTDVPYNFLDPPAPDPGAQSQQVQVNRSAARVPEKVARGVLATGVMVFSSQQEFAVDFFQTLAKPPQLVARVVMTPAVVEGFHKALHDAWAKHREVFGALPELPRNPNVRPLSAPEIYGALKIPDEMHTGTYVNNFLINFDGPEFNFDFVSSLYPQSVVAARVQVAAQRVPGMLEALNTALARRRGTSSP